MSGKHTPGSTSYRIKFLFPLQKKMQLCFHVVSTNSFTIDNYNYEMEVDFP